MSLRERIIASPTSNSLRGFPTFSGAAPPDDELLTLATEGKLKDRNVLRGQVRRMLADRRSEALAQNFAGQWLHLHNLRDVQPDVFTYPDFDDNLLQSMRRETELFFDSMVREDRNVLDLLRPTTPSWMSFWRAITAFPMSKATVSGASR